MSRGGGMKKRALEMALQSLETLKERKAYLEQYETPAGMAADILFFAYSMGDVEGKRVCDLGCGAGIFSIGAYLLGATEVFGIDVDEKAIEVAKRNSEKTGARAVFTTGDVKTFNMPCDTVVQNPPFGSQNRHADRPFLEKAMEIADVIYTMHMKKTEDFIRRMVRSAGAEITHETEYEFPVKRIFAFHRSETMKFPVKMFRIEKR